MRVKLLGAAVLSFGILAVACADAPAGGPGGASGSSGPTGATSSPDIGQLVLRIEDVGGFVPVQYNLTRLPTVSLYDDGLLLIPGAQIEIYPGPALPALSRQHVSSDALRSLLLLAVDAGLGKDRDLRTMTVSDLPTTVFTLVIDGQQHTTRVYGLGVDLSPKPEGMSQEEFQARQELADFQAKVSDTSWLPTGSVTEEGMYEPTALRIFSSPYRPDPELTEPPIAWPLTPGLDAFGDPQDAAGGIRCGTVEGDATASLLPLVERANQLTPWTSDGTRYGLLFRPLLPDESGC